MKTLLLFLFTLPLYSAAQIFPFAEGFYGIPSNTLPAGWSGDMKVRTSHGLDYGKGLAADIGSTDEVDSVITPWIGPLDNNSQFYFWYQMVEELIYPSTEKHLTTDSLVISISTDSVNFTDLYVIDSSNHISTLSFKRITFPVTNYGGQVVKFKFKCKYGIGSSYFVDIDSVRVRVNPNVGINDINVTNVRIYPNPAVFFLRVEAEQKMSGVNYIDIYNLCGQLVSSETLSEEGIADVTSLQPGIYLTRINLGDAILTRKIVIQR